MRPNRLAARCAVVEGRMRKKRDPETEEQRLERLEKQARSRSADRTVEDMAIDAMVKRSIAAHGP